MSSADSKDPDLEFALICNSLVYGVIYDDEVRVHRILENTYTIESTANSEELISIGLSAISINREDDAPLEITETQEINPFRYATTVVAETEQ